MAIDNTFYMRIEDGLIGDKLYGGAVEWDPTKTEYQNISSAINFDSNTGLFDWDETNMPSFQSLIQQAFRNVHINEWTDGAMTGGRSWNLLDNPNFYVRMKTSSWYYPPSDNPPGMSTDYLDYWYSLEFTMPGPGISVFYDNAFSVDVMGAGVTGYYILHSNPPYTWNNSNGKGYYDIYDQWIATPMNTYYLNPYLAPSGLMMFYDEVDGVQVPRSMYYVYIQRDADLVGTPRLRYRLLSSSILSAVLFEEEEEEVEFPGSKLYNLFTTMYAMRFDQVEGLAQYLIEKADDYSGTKSFMEQLLDDMGFQTGVVTDAIIDLTVYPFDIDNVCSHVKTDYLKLGYGSDTLSGTGANLGIFVYPREGNEKSLHKVTWLNTGALYIPQSGDGTVNFDAKIGRFNDFRDYPPYRTIEMFVPYVGIVPVDQRKLYGKRLRLKYIVDFFTGSATALLLAVDNGNETIIESWDCVMGVHEAVGTTNWTEYASRMNSAKSQVVKTGLNLPMSMAKDPVGALSGVIDATRNMATTDGIYTGNVNGTSSSTGNYFMPQHWYIFDYVQETSVTGNLSALSGRASNTSGALSSFSGFLQVSDVDLVCPKATDSEKAKIISLLESGVRI